MSRKFEMTRWSVVLAAQDGSPSQARRALAGFDPRLTEPLRLDDLADRADRLQDLIAAIP